jgi:pimeloyl-ACP methyl ester carboxylesterase
VKPLTIIGLCAVTAMLLSYACSKNASKTVIISGVPPYLLKMADNPEGVDASVSLACVPTWHEDFREDLARMDVPMLVIDGDADRILPITATGLRTAKLIKGARQLVVKDGPHCITRTHAEDVNAELLSEKADKSQKQVA